MQSHFRESNCAQDAIERPFVPAGQPCRAIDITTIARALRLFTAGIRGLTLLAGAVIIAAIGEYSQDQLSSRTLVTAALAAIGAFVIGMGACLARRRALKAAARWKPLFIAVLVFVAGLIWLVRDGSAPGGMPEQEAEYSRVALGLSILLAAVLAVSVGLLRYARLPVLSESFATLIRPRLATMTTSRPPPSRPWQGAAVVALALAVICFESLPFASQARAIMCGLLLLRARRCFQTDYEKLKTHDQRPPVLFLRSFADEAMLAPGEGEIVKALLDQTLEIRLADTITAYGPFVSIGDSLDRLPRRGSVAVELHDEPWHARVQSLMKEATLCVVMVGITQSVAWELRRVVELGKVGHLLIVFPERQLALRRAAVQNELALLQRRLGVVRQAFAGTIWAAELSKDFPVQTLRSILFEADGTIVTVTSRTRCRDSYEIAALIGAELVTRRHQAMQAVPCGQEERPRPSIVQAVS